MVTSSVEGAAEESMHPIQPPDNLTDESVWGIYRKGKGKGKGKGMARLHTLTMEGKETGREA